MSKARWLVVGVLFGALVGFVAAWPRAVHAEEGARPVRLGILSFRSLDQTRARWAPTAEHLQRVLPDRRFEVVPLFYPDLDRAAADGAVDFVFTNPEHYVLLRARHGLAAIATLMPLAEGRPVTEFGGVILVRADRDDLRTLGDLGGKVVAAPSESSLGGYLVQTWELKRRGVTKTRMLFLGMPHDNSVRAVLSGQADAGFVRTGVIESMAREGKLDPSAIKLLNRQPEETFPQRLSTELYPEWPFSASRATPMELTKEVALALLQIPPSSEAATSGRYYGFSPPGDYAPVEALMLRLDMHPGKLRQFDLRDIYEKYKDLIVGGIGLFLLGALLLAIHLARINRRLAASTERDAQLNAELKATIGELERTNHNLERFAFVAAHDLQEPVRSIVSFSQILDTRCAGKLGPQEREYLGFVVEAATRLRDLVNDLLVYSRSLHDKPELRAVPAERALASALARLEKSIDASGARITSQPLPVVLVDEESLVRVFENLIANAIKFVAPGTVPEIAIGSRTDDGEVIFSIHDNGIGIETRYHERVFVIFKRLHTHDVYPGTGLGLALCKRVVECHGGRIWIDPGPGPGTTVHFTLRAAPGT